MGKAVIMAETIRQWLWTWLRIPDGEFVHSEDFVELERKFEELSGRYDRILDALAARAKDSVFDHDKIPVSESGRYVPIARRRLQAERASLGPATHDAKVRENNAKAIGGQ